MITPYQLARQWHVRACTMWQFEHLIAAHGDGGGQCHITPDLFVLARPIKRKWSDDWICDPGVVARRPDCWHVWLLAGDIRAALKLLPYELPFVSWHRRDKLHVWKLQDVLRRFVR